jgi:hypothetical protein
VAAARAGQADRRRDGPRPRLAHRAAGLAPALTGVDELPTARLRALLVDARAARAQMGDARQVATLTAFRDGGAARQDQTLDHLDVILAEIDGRAAARERKRRLEIAGLIDQAAVRLADARAGTQ